MNLELNFNEICALIKKNGKEDSILIDLVDQFLGLALICAPVLTPVAVLAILPTLAVKNELTKIGKTIFDKVSKSSTKDDYVARLQRMQVAYGLLCFTAFFAAVESEMPDILRDKIKLLPNEKEYLVKNALTETVIPSIERTDQCGSDENAYALVKCDFPHPTESLEQQQKRHAALWEKMTKGFQGFIQGLAAWDNAGEKGQAKILHFIKSLPAKTAVYFNSQYLELSQKFPEFAIWANLYEHSKTQQTLGELSVQAHTYLSLARQSTTQMDIGFKLLNAAVLQIPETIKIKQAITLVGSLRKHYQARINDPIINDNDDGEDEGPKLAFPLVCDAFIPQAFRVLRHKGKMRPLEDDATWNDLPRRDNLNSFLLSYLTSPYSTETPLLILGHPGSGKSLLTTVLAAQLMSTQFTAIRVPLREVDAEASIVTQIEEAIRCITHINQDSWASISVEFENNPLLVILDGYDELLQASGKVFSGYLKTVQDFQKHQTEQGRPVRVIVTSRVTLIDKAQIPLGTTVLRLLEFDANQQSQWTSIWNVANVNYFIDAGVEKFALPTQKDDGAKKILALAEQPLLLLMLALYDSQGNPLKKAEAVDRTKLYNNLLHRFIARELTKDKQFGHLPDAEQTARYENEMQRLRISALGMYNRRKVHILKDELNQDLKFFDVIRPLGSGSGVPLTHAESLLGSFFFIHKSKAQHSAGTEENRRENSAFEFLHNTFGEFLTADFILRCTLHEVTTYKDLDEQPRLAGTLNQRLQSADGFHSHWFAGLIYTPLFTRPVILEMIREWVSHLLPEQHLASDDLITYLDKIIINQIKRLLEKSDMPSMMSNSGQTAPSFEAHPLLGHIAIYSMNLILLRVMVGGPYVFDEAQICTYEDGTRPWDRLTNIWRAWFSLDNLSAAAAILVADRNGTQVTIQAQRTIRVITQQDRLTTIFNVGRALGDNITTGLAGFQLFNPSNDNVLDLNEIYARLESENIDLGIDFAMKRLLDLEQNTGDDDIVYEKAAFFAFRLALRARQYMPLETIALSVQRVMQSRTSSRASLEWEHNHLRMHRVVDSRIASELASYNPKAGLILWEIAIEVRDERWCEEFTEMFVEFPLHNRISRISRDRQESMLALGQLLHMIFDKYNQEKQRRPMNEFLHHMTRTLSGENIIWELIERNPEAALTWLQLENEVNDEVSPRRANQEDELWKLLHAPEMVHIFLKKPASFIAMLKMIRHQRRSYMHSRLLEKLTSIMAHYDFGERFFANIPLAALTDLRWFAENAPDGEVQTVIQNWLKKIMTD